MKILKNCRVGSNFQWKNESFSTKRNENSISNLQDLTLTDIKRITLSIKEKLTQAREKIPNRNDKKEYDKGISLD